MTKLILLDFEAVQALGSIEHPKHRRVLSHIEVIAQRKRRAIPVSVRVPSAVRVEAGWDRTAPGWALANRLRIADQILDEVQANTAASLRARTHATVPDAHIGAAIQSTDAEQITVLTSDPGDARTVAGNRRVTIVRTERPSRLDPLQARQSDEEGAQPGREQRGGGQQW